jgi:hypothetical protein
LTGSLLLHPWLQLLAVGAGDINTGGTDTRESANGLQSCQTVDDGLAASFLDSLDE